MDGAGAEDERAFPATVSDWSEEQKSGDWDVLVCPDIDERMAPFAGFAKQGIWWISIDPRPGKRSDVRCQLGSMLAHTPVRVSLWRISRDGGSPELLETASVRQVSGFSLRRNMAAIAPLRRQIWTATLSRLQRNGSVAAHAGDGGHSVSNPVAVAGLAIARLAVRQFRLRRELRNRTESWQVGIRRTHDAGAGFGNPVGYHWLAAPPHSWLADPCPVSAHGGTWLFLEKFDAHRKLGEICCCEVRSDGSTGPLLDVLRKPYHLSYPHIFSHEGDIFMIPETGANNTVELYRAVDFPLRWELVRILYAGPAFDTTVLQADGRFWFFTSIVEGADRVASQLLLFHSARPDGDWCMHPASPLSMDARWARCAGRIFVQDGQLVRPAQDCSRIYGGSIEFRAIVALNEREYSEKTIDVLTPEAWKGEGAIGVHTYDRAGGIEVIDRLLVSRAG